MRKGEGEEVLVGVWRAFLSMLYLICTLYILLFKLAQFELFFCGFLYFVPFFLFFFFFFFFERELIFFFLKKKKIQVNILGVIYYLLHWAFFPDFFFH